MTSLLAALALAWLGLTALMFLGQRKLMYFPDRARVSPAAAGLPAVRELELATPDGERLIAWHGKARPGRPTILYFHGNGGSLAARADRIRQLMAAGLGVLMPTYRGYGGSSGSPTEAHNVADARLALAHLRGLGVPARSVVLYGESLGSGVAVQLAAAEEVAGVILDAPFTSAVDVAGLAYPWLPVRWAMLDRYDSAAHIGRVRAPLLVMHGERDAVIPLRLGRALFELANEPKRLVTFRHGNHSDLFQHGALQAVLEFVAGLGGAPARRPI
jgi:hypothetical protein